MAERAIRLGAAALAAAALLGVGAAALAAASPPASRPAQLSAARLPGRRATARTRLPPHRLAESGAPPDGRGRHVTVRASAGRPLRRPEPMARYAGREVPRGSCAAPVGTGVPVVLPCGSAPVRAWRAGHPWLVAEGWAAGLLRWAEARRGAVAAALLTAGTWAVVGVAALVGRAWERGRRSR